LFLETTFPARPQGDGLRSKRRCLEIRLMHQYYSALTALSCADVIHINPRVQCFLDIKERKVAQSFPFFDLPVSQFLVQQTMSGN